LAIKAFCACTFAPVWVSLRQPREQRLPTRLETFESALRRSARRTARCRWRRAHRRLPNAMLQLFRKAKKRREVYEMNPSSMLELADRYLNAPHFKERMRKDPEGTAESTGLKLDDVDRRSIRSWEMSSSGEEQLEERISKGMGVN
jgi:hypothetical protein